MNLSFSIENWNQKSWEEFCSVAQETRMKGIELYNIDNDIFSGKKSPTNPQLSSSEKRHLAARGLQIPCFDTAADFMDPEFAVEFARTVEAAANLGAPYVSVHTETTDQQACRIRIGELMELLGNSQVSLLVKTTGPYADTDHLRDLLNNFSDDRLAAVWMMYDTCVSGKEDAEETITNLGAYVKHVQIHAFRRNGTAAEPELIGEGELPIKDMMNALRSVNYDGFISVVWNPDWMPG